jgi:hypothetical protein
MENVDFMSKQDLTEEMRRLSLKKERVESTESIFQRQLLISGHCEGYVCSLCRSGTGIKKTGLSQFQDYIVIGLKVNNFF